MEGIDPEHNYNVVLRLPVKVDYQVLQVYLQKKLLGKIISKGKANGETLDRARIQGISLERSTLDDFDLAVHVQLKLLTTFFKNKVIKLVAHLSLAFNEADQQVHIRRYKLDSENNGWITDKLVESIVNNFMYSKLKEKMKFDIRPVVIEKLDKLNHRLTGGMEVADGISITGKLKEFRVEEIIPGQRTLLVAVSILGNNVLNIKKIDI
ncbi:DUF4403 family protein [Salinimicrobium sp. HB62]|uniref:DUF4403 family protein n=1 Tax=Salinimicrobium sp. HB62 TaxID=3077781 RepID=UPI002D79D6DB|nr:DUF4403 family protein [Salinimicrobium sp. HB62]